VVKYSLPFTGRRRQRPSMVIAPRPTIAIISLVFSLPAHPTLSDNQVPYAALIAHRLMNDRRQYSPLLPTTVLLG
jgi:hypothetical protein